MDHLQAIMSLENLEPAPTVPTDPSWDARSCGLSDHAYSIINHPLNHLRISPLVGEECSEALKVMPQLSQEKRAERGVTSIHLVGPFALSPSNPQVGILNGNLPQWPWKPAVFQRAEVCVKSTERQLGYRSS